MSKHVTSASLTSVKDTTSPVLSPDVFARSIQQYQDAGYRLAYSLLGQRQAAEDAVQEAVLHAWEARERYDETKGTFSAWFLGIVHHRATDEARHRGVVLLHAAPVGNLEEVFLRVPDRAFTPDAVALYKESWQALLDAIKKLPPKFHQVVVLRYGEGLKCEEVALRLGLEPATVRVRLSRAHKLLREQVAHVRQELLQSV